MRVVRIQTSSIAALLLGALLAAAAPAVAGEGDLVRSVPAASGGTLYVDLDRGRVDVLAHDEPVVRIEAQARGLGASSIHFELRAEGEDLILTGRGEDWLAWMATSPSVRVRAWIPRSYGVQVRTEVREIAAEIRNTGL